MTFYEFIFIHSSQKELVYDRRKDID